MIVLASKSPRRQELLKFVVDDFIVDGSEVDEALDLSDGIIRGIEGLAFSKASEVFKRHLSDVVIGADTLVVCGEDVLGKPKNKDEAVRMLELLSDNTHVVITAVSIISKKMSMTFNVVSEVIFYKLTKEEIEDYIEKYQPYDKAGAYAIQDKAALFIKEIKGDYYNIMGLPIAELNQRLKRILD